MNGAYTEQELLLLSNFVYIPVSMSTEPIGDIIDKYRDETGAFSAKSVASAAYGGGMSCEDVAIVFSEMDMRIKENPSFGQLSVSRGLDEYDVRALCYTGVHDNDPVVAFRGTGGTRSAWSDNFEGAFYEDTRIQKVANDFLEYECGIYDDIVVTGHSKGGNLAQYVTVRQKERISSCTSFDGQGFSQYFLEAYADEIKLAAPKIKSVSAYNDFVNILLTCIAGECIYVANEESAAAAHSSVTLLTANDFDNDGNIVSIRDQALVSKVLSKLTDGAVAALSKGDKDDKDDFSLIMGSAISLALTTPADSLKEGVIAPTVGMITGRFAKDLMKTQGEAAAKEVPVSRSASINTGACLDGIQSIEEMSARIGRIADAVNEIRGSLAYSVTAKVCAEHALESVSEDLMREAGDLENYADTARRAALAYEATESGIVSLMSL